jgi:hypothetical protein
MGIADYPDTPEMRLLWLAVRMRRAQVEYFGSKNHAALVRAKELERDFDRLARQALGQAGEVRQPGSINPPR